MIISGPSLLPGSIDADLYTGHPLMFYFLSSAWMTLFGTDLFTAHLFPVLIACLFFVAVYILVNEMSDPISAFFSALILSLQAVTIAQSGMMLSEILLALFSFLALYFYIRKQYIWMVLLLSCLVLTKEAGLVMCCVLALFGCIYSLRVERKINFKFLKICGLFFIPFVVGFSFYLMQKIRLGWFLFPRHSNWIDFSLDAVLGKLSGSVNFIFLNQGRFLISVILLIFLILILIHKVLIHPKLKEPLLILSSFIIFYLIFCIINFLSPRYLYSAIPALIILSVLSLRLMFKNNRVFIVVMFIISIYFISFIPSSFKRGIGDTELSYADMVKIHLTTIKYLETHISRSEHIAAHFLMREQLNYKTCGYLSGAPFIHMTPNVDDQSRFLIVSAIEQEFDLVQLRTQYDLKLVKHFESGVAWTDIYAVKKISH